MERQRQYQGIFCSVLRCIFLPEKPVIELYAWVTESYANECGGTGVAHNPPIVIGYIDSGRSSAVNILKTV